MSSHPNLLDANNSVLLLVDIQTRLSAAMTTAESQQMSLHCERLLQAAALLDVPVIVTEQYPQGLGPTQANLLERLPAAAQVFAKTGFSCCAAEGFNGTLAALGRKQVVLAGQETHVCVLQTALELQHLGYQVHVLADAVCSRRAEHKAFALQRMQQQGVTLTCHESALFEWLRDARHERFKTISSLLR